MRPPRNGWSLAIALVGIALAVAAFRARPAVAESVFAVGGLGEPSLEENAALRALGGAGVAEHGPSSFSLVNPASTAEAQHLILEATFLSTRRNISTVDFGDETAYETSIPSVRMNVRLPAGFVLGGSYLLGTSGQFAIDRPDTSGVLSTLHIDGSGGINYARGTLARKLTKRLLLGVDYEVVGGSFREEWTRRFPDVNLATARDTLETSWQRLGRWRAGAVWAPLSWFSVGGVYETGRRLPMEQRHRTAGADEITMGNSLDIPSGWATGFNLSLTDRSRIVGQYRRQQWDATDLNTDLVILRWQERYSVGLERRAGVYGSPLSKMPLRIGATFLRWPDLLPVAGATDISGGVAGVNEWAVSIGSGLVTRDKGGALDVSLEGGRRGSKTDLGAEETFIRAALSLRVSDETWK
jgi:hypothetical protein